MYAEGTRVSTEKSRQEVERLLAQHGGRMMAAFMPDGAVVLVFAVRTARGERMVRFTVPLPAPEKIPARRGRLAAEERHERAVRQRWRVLLLLLKAKLEAVAAGVRPFEEEFLADLVTHAGQTVADMTLPALLEAYEREGMPFQALPPPPNRLLSAGTKE